MSSPTVEFTSQSRITEYTDQLTNTCRNMGFKPLERDMRHMATKIGNFVQQITPENRRLFLRHSYIQDAIEGTIRRKYDKTFDHNHPSLPDIDYVLSNVQPDTVNLALTTVRLVHKIGQNKDFQQQFIPALNIACFVALEYIQKNKIDIRNPREGIKKLKALSKTEKLKGKQSINRTLIRTLEDFSDKPPKSPYTRLVEGLSVPIYRNLEHWTSEMQVLDQPQGVEVEVLSYKTSSDAAETRGVDVKRWLPRGLKTETLARRDWPVVAILGIPEDPGETPYQTFEMSPLPSETEATQGSMLWSLTAGEFIDERVLSNEKEGYSLHVTTLFPSDIWTDKAEQQYHGLSRVLSGAFSSMQRIQYGGFAAGRIRREVRSPSGKLLRTIDTSGEIKGRLSGAKQIKKDVLGDEPVVVRQETPESITRAHQKMLVEIRSFDVTPATHYSALHAKECLDFAFKAYWTIQQNLDLNPTSLMIKAAKQWEQFDAKRRDIFRIHNISENNMTGWLELAQAVDQNRNMRRQIQTELRKNPSPQRRKELHDKLTANPDLQKQLAQLTRRHANSVRREAVAYNETLKRKPGWAPRRLLSEPKSTNDNRIYLDDSDRSPMNLPALSDVQISFGAKQMTTRVAMAKTRNNGTFDAATSGNWRVSKNIIEQLGLPEGTPLRMEVEVVGDKREIKLGPVVGLLTSGELSDKPGQLLKGLRKEEVMKHYIRTARKNGIFAYTFFPQDVSTSRLNTFAYTLDDHDNWVKVRVPLPNAIYSYEKLSPEKKALQQRLDQNGNSIPFISAAELTRLVRS